MYKYGLKLWSTNMEMIDASRDLYDKGLFNYIELYVVPGSFHECINAWRSIGIPTILHAPHSYSGLNMSQRSYESKNASLIGETEAFRAALGSEVVIFHPGIDGLIQETIYQINSLKAKYATLFEGAVIENKPKVGLHGEECVGSTPDEIKHIMSSTGMGFCLDVGHAIYSSVAHGCEPNEIIEGFLSLDPSMYHVSDGMMDSPTDMHLRMGEGNFPLKEITNSIPRGSLVTIETVKDLACKLKDFEQDVAFLRDITSSNVLRLRPIEAQDCELIWKWANDSTVRDASFSSENISWDGHRSWFKSKLQSEQCHFFIAEDGDGAPLGQVCLEDGEEGTVISVSVAADYRKRGFGKELIRLATERYFSTAGSKLIHAYVKVDNETSLNAFRSVGYCELDRILLKGHKSVHLIREK